MSARRPASIRLLLGALLGLVMLLAAGLFSVTILQRDTAAQRTAAEHQRVTSFLLSDQMRQSSNDLTRMVRLYVTTGDPRYRSYYDQILAIRRGLAPRPVNYDSSFWDRVLADGAAAVPSGPATSLTALMRRANFANAEFTALNASLRASDQLAQRERRVMDAVAPRIAAGVDRGYLGAVAPEYRLLVDAAYHREKGRIMAAIARFTALVDARTSAREASLQSRTQSLLVAQTAILALLGVTLILTLAVAARTIARPLARLTAVTRRIARGDWSQRAPADGVAELRELAADFNKMADAIEADIIERTALEDELRRAREAAESADRAKSAFLAVMSHELRTPLVAVTGTLEVLALGPLDRDQRGLIDVATRSARALLGVIGDVLDFSKIEAGHLDLTPAPTSISGLVDDVLAQHRLAVRDRAVILRSAVDPRLAGRHEVDPVRLRQVLGNLVGNAVKFTRVGRVEVGVEVGAEADPGAGQEIVLVVSDTGVGVGVEDQARLFEPFEQARSGPGGGTGLGLVICRQLVEAMGGTVSLTSQLGQGTTVRVALTLPVAAGPQEEVAAVAVRRPLPTRGAAEREGSLLLLVEDHPVNRDVLARQLEAIGFVTDTAADAEEAGARFERCGYGLVFTDISLPGVDGHGLARRLRAIEERDGRARAPIVALTANALRGERERCAEAGMDDLVVKPAMLATLAATLRRWLPDIAWPQSGADRSGPAVDRSALDELTGGDAALNRDILTRYLESLTEELDALGPALRDRDLEAMARHAHRIAGASRTVGAHAVAAEAARLERAAQDEEDSAELERLVAALSATASP